LCLLAEPESELMAEWRKTEGPETIDGLNRSGDVGGGVGSSSLSISLPAAVLKGEGAALEEVEGAALEGGEIWDVATPWVWSDG
jgi:hypothetical protein